MLNRNRKTQAASWGFSLLSGGLAGVADFFLFHPFDTALRRMQNAHRPPHLSLVQYPSYYQRVIFNGVAVNKGIYFHFSSLYAAAIWGLLYKVTARTYKFGTQPFLENYLQDHCGHWIKQHVDFRCQTPLLKACAASLIGMGEFIFAPLDALVVKYQANEQRPVWQLLRSEGMNIYRGCGWTSTRNAVGSFFLFSVPALMSAWISDTTGKRYSWQEGVSNFFGGVACSVATSPFDVVKTRVQTQGGQTSGFSVMRDIFRTESVGALFQGLTLRTLLLAPRLALVKTVAEALPALWQKYYAGDQAERPGICP